MGVLSSLGIGSASVDLVLPSDRLRAGESVAAYVEVVGGSEEQTVDGIYFALRTRYQTEEGKHTTTISEFDLEDGFTIGADEEKTFDVTIDVPAYTPTTVFGGTEVWIDTGLDIDWAADPDDKDEVDVEPGPHLEALHDALGSLGFDLKGAPTVTARTDAYGEAEEIGQEFEYRPVGEYSGDLEELEAFVFPGAETTRVELVVDLPDTMLAERERVTEVTVDTDDAEAIAGEVRSVIEAELGD